MNPLSRFFHRRKALGRPFDWKNGRRVVEDVPGLPTSSWGVPDDGELHSVPITQTVAVHPYFIEDDGESRTAA